MNQEPNTLHDDLATLPLAKLIELYAKAAIDLEFAKDRIAFFTGELVRRFAPDFKLKFAEADKVSGDVTIERDGVAIKGEISKKVEWDSKALMALAANMPWEKVGKLFKISFEMTETMYKSLAATDPELYASVTKARTVKYGDLKVKPKFDAKG